MPIEPAERERLQKKARETAVQAKNLLAKSKGDRTTYEYWFIGEGRVRYRLPNQLNFHTLSRADFERNFEPIAAQKEEAPAAVQGGLF